MTMMGRPLSRRLLIGAGIAALGACKEKKRATYQPTQAPGPAPAPASTASGGWALGPVINGQNYSVGTVCDPNGNFGWPVAQKGLDRWATPGPHYLTRSAGGMAGVTMRARYEVIGDGQFFGTVGSQSELAYLCLHFQRAGDSWSGEDPFEAHRWWSAETFPLTPGVHEAAAALTRDHWVSVYDRGTPEQFAAALAEAVVIGVTFGNDEGKGHGVSSPTGGSSFVLHSFTVS